MKMKSRKSGISLISLIITIIVIIILAAVVIFSGMDTPEKAQLSKVISDIDNVQTAVDQAYYGLYTEKAVVGEVWTKSQFYEAVATGKKNREDLTATGLVEIAEDSLVDINLPVYEGRKWYVAVSDVSDTVKTGSAVLSPGFESQGKTYATLLDIQNGGSDGAGSNGGNDGGQESLTEEDKALLASIKIGDFVNYKETDVTSSKGIEGEGDEDNPVYWRVIDKNEETGEVLITTSDAVGNITLSGAEDYIDIATNKGNTKLDQYCKANYTAYGATSVRSMTAEDMEKLCSPYGITKTEYSDEKYAYYPSGATSNVTGNKNGNGVTYNGVNYGDDFYNGYDKGIFLTYDVVDAEGKVTTYTATKLEESQTVGDGGYKILKEGEPVLVSNDYYWYYIPSEVEEIIGTRYSWLASACVRTLSDYAYFNVRRVADGLVDAYFLCYSGGYEYGGSLGLRPVVSLSSKLLEQGSEGGDVTGEYKVWKLK